MSDPVGYDGSVIRRSDEIPRERVVFSKADGALQDALREAGEKLAKAEAEDQPVVREFSSGANRDVDTGKLDYEGFYSPYVMQRFALYMNKNRKLRDGTLRDSDNWQKGIPLGVYMKSMFRHFMEVWAIHRGVPVERPEEPEHEVDMEEALCGLLFNVQGMLHEIVKERTDEDR